MYHGQYVIPWKVPWGDILPMGRPMGRPSVVPWDIPWVKRHAMGDPLGKFMGRPIG